jgi:hypothetical protein
MAGFSHPLMHRPVKPGKFCIDKGFHKLIDYNNGYNFFMLVFTSNCDVCYKSFLSPIPEAECAGENSQAPAATNA